MVFFGSGEGKGEYGATGRGGGRGVVFLLKIPRGGGVSRNGGGGESREGVCGEFEGGCIFFWGPKCPPRTTLTLFNFFRLN